MLVLFIGVLLFGCASTGSRLFYRDKDAENFISYLSADSPQFKLDIPGTKWKASSTNEKHGVLQSTEGPRRIINIIEYNDDHLGKGFYKQGYTEGQAIDEYIKYESAYHIGKNQNATLTIISKNIKGPIVPNTLWAVEGANFKIYFVSMSVNRHLISVSTQEFESPYGTQEFVTEIFQSIKLLDKERADQILKSYLN
jgi:hypothetical protein